jgi:hypothetical protein
MPAAGFAQVGESKAQGTVELQRKIENAPAGQPLRNGCVARNLLILSLFSKNNPATIGLACVSKREGEFTK